MDGQKKKVLSVVNLVIDTNLEEDFYWLGNK